MEELLDHFRYENSQIDRDTWTQEPISVNADGTFYTVQDFIDEKEDYCPFSRLLKGEKIKLTLHRIKKKYWSSDTKIEDRHRIVKEIMDYTKIGQNFMDIENQAINLLTKEAISGKWLIFKKGRYDKIKTEDIFYELLTFDYVIGQPSYLDGYYLSFVSESKVEEIKKDKDSRYLIIELDNIKEVLPRLYYTVSILKALYGTDTNSPYYDGITDEQVDQMQKILPGPYFSSEKLEHVYRCRNCAEDGV